MRVIHTPDPHTCKSVTFRASWVDPGSYGLVKAKELTFALGMGPCGRFVTSLRCEVSTESVLIEQCSQPDDKPCPDYRLALYLREQVLRSERALKAAQVEHLTAQLLVRHGNWVGRWPFKRFISAPSVPFEFKPGRYLTDSEKDAIAAIIEDISTGQRDWHNRNEIKQFVYKMSDVHGRIVTIK